MTNPAWRITPYAMLTFCDGHTEQVRSVIGEFIHTFHERHREALSTRYNPNSGRWVGIGRSRFDERRFLSNVQGTWGVALLAGNYGTVGPVGLGAHIQWIQGVGTLDWWCPDPLEVLADVLAIAPKLRPLAGQAGIGLVLTIDVGIARRQAPPLAEITAAHPGLDLVDPEMGVQFRRNPTGAHWLTVLDDTSLAKLKGPMPGTTVRHDYQGGTVLQTGARPDLHDVTGRTALWSWIEPATVPFETWVRGSLEQGFGPEQLLAWQRRLDGTGATHTAERDALPPETT